MEEFFSGRSLRPSTVDGVEFIHNSFKEYLAASYYVDMQFDEKILEMMSDPSQQSIFVFTFVLLPMYKKQKLIEQLLGLLSTRRASKISESEKHLILLACRISIHSRLFEPKLRDRIATIVRALFPPQSIEIAELVAGFGDSSVRYLQYDGAWKSDEKISAIAALQKIDTELSIAVLREYRKDGDKKVQQYLTGVSQFPVDDCSYLSFILKSESASLSIGDLRILLGNLKRRASETSESLSFRGHSIFSKIMQIESMQRALRHNKNDELLRDI